MHFSSKTRNELFHRIFEIYLSIFKQNISIVSRTISSFVSEFGQIRFKDYNRESFLNNETREIFVKMCRNASQNRWTLKNLSLEMSCRGSIRKFVRLFNVKNAMPEINISNFKKVNFKNFPPPSPFPRNLGSIHAYTHAYAYTHTSEYSNAPRIFSLLCTSFLLPPLFLSSFPRIHSRIFKSFQRNDFSCICSLPGVELSSRYQHYELFLRSKINRGRTESNVFSIPARFHPITFYSITFFADTNFESI